MQLMYYLWGFYVTVQYFDGHVYGASNWYVAVHSVHDLCHVPNYQSFI